jgi:hypothetical protein
MRWLPVVVLAAGCGSKQKPPPPPAEREVTGVASIAGDWVADDEMSWSYALTIQPDGAYTGKIDRGKLPRCDREGTLTVGDSPRKLKLAMKKNTCEQAIANAGVADVEVASFTGDVLTLIVTADGVAERRTYTRRPN